MGPVDVLRVMEQVNARLVSHGTPCMTLLAPPVVEPICAVFVSVLGSVMPVMVRGKRSAGNVVELGEKEDAPFVVGREGLIAPIAVGLA